MVALKVYDPREAELPPVGVVYLTDSESGEKMWIDTSDKKLRDSYRYLYMKRDADLQAIFKKSGVDFATIATDKDYVKALISLFKRRGA